MIMSCCLLSRSLFGFSLCFRTLMEVLIAIKHTHMGNCLILCLQVQRAEFWQTDFHKLITVWRDVLPVTQEGYAMHKMLCDSSSILRTFSVEFYYGIHDLLYLHFGSWKVQSLKKSGLHISHCSIFPLGRGFLWRHSCREPVRRGHAHNAVVCLAGG